MDAKTAEELSALANRLKFGSPVRFAALAVIRHQHTGREAFPEIEPLTAALRDPGQYRWNERLVAARVLDHADLDEDQRYAAASALYDALVERNFASTLGERAIAGVVRAAAMIVGVPLAVLAILWALLLVISDGWAYFEQVVIAGAALFLIGIVLGIPVAIVLAPFYVPLALDRENRVRVACAEALGRMAYPTAVGGLALAARESHSGLRRASRLALRPCVEALDDKYLGRCGSMTIERICQLLFDSDLETTLLALEALRMVGDGSSAADVAAVVKRGRTEEARARAAEVLPILEARRRRESDPQVLLRAAASPDVAEDILLRPARSAEPDPRTLLRVAESPDGNADA